MTVINASHFFLDIREHVLAERRASLRVIADYSTAIDIAETIVARAEIELLKADTERKRQRLRNAAILSDESWRMPSDCEVPFQ